MFAGAEKWLERRNEVNQLSEQLVDEGADVWLHSVDRLLQSQPAIETSLIRQSKLNWLKMFLNKPKSIDRRHVQRSRWFGVHC